jgi:23S rRNA (uracil1939-C5)-methyltransferase
VPGAGPITAGDEVNLEVVDLAFGGRGVARTAAGLVVFVTGGLPGEAVRARVDRIRKGYADATCLEVLRASSARAVPPCGHYGSCGGCDLQHLAPGEQARAKRAQVEALLARVAGCADAPVRETVTVGEPLAYRFRMDFDWGVDAAGAAALGLHRRDRPAEIVPIADCRILPDAGNSVRNWIAEQAGERGLGSGGGTGHRGLLRRVGVQMGRATGEILVTLETGRGGSKALVLLARDLMRRHAGVVGVVRRMAAAPGRPEQAMVLVGRDHLFEGVDGDRLLVPAGAFFQPNVFSLARLRREAVDLLDPRPDESILELFCGVGYFTLELARRSASVLAVEGSREAVAAARRNAADAGIGNARFLCREVSEAMPDLLRRGGWGALLVDPPRSGLPPGAAADLVRSGLRRLVYVSCDPGTLARDVRLLASEDGFRVQCVVPLDLFPQTHHVECVALLARQGD